jgi:xanthine dehydrogenase accessory factor
MKEYLDVINEWFLENKEIALARVIKTWGSSPRPIGSLMLVNSDGKMSGSVSGGCVEGSVVKKSLALLEKKESERVSYGVSDEEAWEVGLSCGGSIQVLLQTVDFNDKVWSTLKKNVENNKSSIVISSIEDGKNSNSLIDEDGSVVGDEISEELRKAAKEAYDERSSRIVSISDKEYFIQIFPRKDLLLIIGAAHITVDLVSFGNQFGFETVVIDPRGFFSKNTVFNSPPDQSIEAYPSEVLNKFPLDAYTFCAILSHDPKIDDNALEILLPSDVAYIGALGSKKTHAKRTNRLLEKGISQELIDKIYAPIGLSINARSAKEIALSIISQIIEVKNQFIFKK